MSKAVKKAFNIKSKAIENKYYSSNVIIFFAYKSFGY